MMETLMPRSTLFLVTTCTALTTPAMAADTSLNGLKSRIVGTWTSIACEIRPAIDQTNPEGKPVPSYLTRDFTYAADGGFEANITVFGDAGCQVPLIAYDFAGDVIWHNANPAVDGAWSQDYELSKELAITVLAEPMAVNLNSLPTGACGDAPYEVGVAQDILGKPCVLLNFIEGSDIVVDHDFLYVKEDTPNMLFMGGKHVDGTGFYYPENRPSVGLQQPLIRVE